MSCVMISIIKFSLELFINFRISVDSKEKKKEDGCRNNDPELFTR